MKKILILSLILSLCLAACGPNYSNGERIGVVTKLSYKGVVFKSWEGELTPSAAPGTMASANSDFTFNVSPEALEKVKAAIQSGKRVKLVYRQWLLQPWTIDNDHVVIDVQELPQ